VTAKLAGDCICVLIATKEARRATKFVSPTLTVKATRRHRFDKRSRFEEFFVTIGRPNYRERVWIKTAQRAGVPFPVRRLQLTFWPKKKGA
jgi:hypothetical protein